MTLEQFAFFMMLPLGALGIAAAAILSFHWEEAQLERTQQRDKRNPPAE